MLDSLTPLGNAYWLYTSFVTGLFLFAVGSSMWVQDRREAAYTLWAFGVNQLCVGVHRTFWLMAETYGPGTVCGKYGDWACTYRDVLVPLMVIAGVSGFVALRRVLSARQAAFWIAGLPALVLLLVAEFEYMWLGGVLR